MKYLIFSLLLTGCMSVTELRPGVYQARCGREHKCERAMRNKCGGDYVDAKWFGGAQSVHHETGDGRVTTRRARQAEREWRLVASCPGETVAPESGPYSP